MVHLARSANEERNLAYDLLPILEHLPVRERLHLLDGARDGMRNAATLEVDCIEHIAHDFFGNIVVAVDFLDNNAAFFFHLLLVHARVHEHVGNHVDSERKMAPFNLRVEPGLLPCGVSFQVPALVLDGVRDFEGAALFGSLEYQVLVEVAQPEFVLRLVSGSARHPNANRNRVSVRHVVCQDGDAVIENCFLNCLFHFARLI